MARLNSGPLVAAQQILNPDVLINSPDTIEIPGWPGAYALLIHVPTDMQVRFARRSGRLDGGWYVYAGSAHGPGGVGARVRRHLRREKKPHWHVDSLTMASDRMAALAMRQGRECDVVRRLCASGRFVHAIDGFGSSDCTSCRSHLLAWRP